MTYVRLYMNPVRHLVEPDVTGKRSMVLIGDSKIPMRSDHGYLYLDLPIGTMAKVWEEIKDEPKRNYKIRHLTLVEVFMGPDMIRGMRLGAYELPGNENPGQSPEYRSLHAEVTCSLRTNDDGSQYTIVVMEATGYDLDELIKFRRRLLGKDEKLVPTISYGVVENPLPTMDMQVLATLVRESTAQIVEAIEASASYPT